MNDKKTKILIVDDNSSMIETLTDILLLYPYRVDSAEDGPTAIEKVKKNGMAVVLMDYKMPGMNGVEAFREMIKINPGLKIIFITAYYTEKTINEALDEGACGICHKPLDLDHLLDQIRAAIER